MNKTLTVTTKTGIHAQEASQLVAVASKFQADVTLNYREKSVDAKSILGVMSLGIYPQSSIEFVVTGEDALQAVEAIQTLLA